MNWKTSNKQAEDIYRAYSLNPQLIQNPVFYQQFKAHWPWFIIKRIVIERWTELGRKCTCCEMSITSTSELHVDHIKPKSKHPNERFLLSNLQVLCVECNMLKGDYDGKNWRAYVSGARSRNRQFGITNNWSKIARTRRARLLPQSKAERRNSSVNAALGLSGVAVLIFSLSSNSGWAFLIAALLLAFAFDSKH